MPFWGTFKKWAKITGSTLRGQKWRFFEVRSSAVCCPFELKIAWGLCLALKSSHINFQLKRTEHGWGSDLAKTPKSTFSENLEKSTKSEKWPKSGDFLTKNEKFRIDLLVSLFWPFLCLLSNLFGLSNFSTPNRHFLRLFSRGEASKSHDFGVYFEGSWWVQTNCWKCTF